MLLIIFLGLIAKLTSVYGDCVTGPSEVDDFDWNKYSGPRPWYALLHSPNDFENDFSCVVVKYGSPERNTSLITVVGYSSSAKHHIIIYGNATNWNSAGYFDINIPVSRWNGRLYVSAVDYDRYVVIKFCSPGSDEPFVYVLSRSNRPDEKTIKKVREELQENNIDVSQLVEFSADHCQQLESPTERRSCE